MRKLQPEPRYLAIGRVLRPHGVRGELRVELLTAHPEHLAELKTLYVGDAYQPHAVLSARMHKDLALILLQGYETRNAADALRDEFLYVALEDAIPLDEDEYYEYQLEGLVVVTEDGEQLGEIAEVFTAPDANDVFIVHGPLGEVLIPVIEDVIVDCDLEGGQVTVRLLPGLIQGR
ncbi:MAG: 16S rRNA processing protein RimM [Anaerolineae bacterium]|nr:16S rRNA processing protein RimM [Anaerolineae bacterium]